MKESERFWSKVDVGEADECWEWLAGKDGSGYGSFWVSQRVRMSHAHRVSWYLTFGPIPNGLWVLHKCDNRSCCNPYHLFLGTHTDNIQDAARKGRMARKGESNPSSKLIEDEVLEIRELRAEGWTQRDLAKEFDVSRGTIRKILAYKMWKWL